jgi:hypothetical protein
VVEHQAGVAGRAESFGIGIQAQVRTVPRPRASTSSGAWPLPAGR